MYITNRLNRFRHSGRKYFGKTIFRDDLFHYKYVEMPEGTTAVAAAKSVRNFIAFYVIVSAPYAPPEPFSPGNRILSVGDCGHRWYSMYVCVYVKCIIIAILSRRKIFFFFFLFHTTAVESNEIIVIIIIVIVIMTIISIIITMI